jgi:hypothetical protein
MKRIMLLILVLTVVLSVPSLAGRITSTMITNLRQVYQVAAVLDSDTAWWLGYLGQGDDVITAAPGVLAIDPGDPKTMWPNFVTAAQQTPAVAYTIKNVTLTKQCVDYTQCHGWFLPNPVTQQGSSNIRLWWPLMYEAPSCQFTLTILYGTFDPFDDDGPSGPNPAAWVHAEKWIWHVNMDLNHLVMMLDLFHEAPFGRDEVPLISDEYLFEDLREKLTDPTDGAIYWYYTMANTAKAAEKLTDFELEVMDGCIGDDSPPWPNPTGPGTGIANSDENPACCKLLVDVEYIFQTTGIGQPKKK